MHKTMNTDYRYRPQALPIPILSALGISSIVHNRFMADATFDRDRVKAAMKDQRVTQAWLAREVGLTHKSAVAKILAGTRDISYAEAVKIYELLRLLPEGATGVQRIPVIGLTSAGNWREAIEMPIWHLTIPSGASGRRAFAVQVVGDSMNKLIRDGGYVVIDPDQKSLNDGKCYLIQNGEHEVTVKAYRNHPARFEPLSDNELHEGFLVSECDFIVLGRVVWTGSPL